MQIKIALLQYKCFSSSSAHYNPIIVLTIFCASNFASEYSTIKEKKKTRLFIILSLELKCYGIGCTHAAI